MLAGSDISVVEGQQGWLFLERYEDARPLHFASDLSEWSRTTLPLLRSVLRSRHQRLAARGIEMVLLIAPEKSSIYDEFLPAGVMPDLPTAASRLVAAAREDGLNAVDAVALLRQAKGAVPLYCDIDSHWTFFAAYRVYRTLLAALPERLGLEPVRPETAWYSDKPAFGDLGIHMHPERKGSVPQLQMGGPEIRSIVDTYDDREHAFQRFTCATGRGRALILRDSFTTFLAPFLSCTFADTTYVAPSDALPDDLVDDLAPDVVVVQVAERALFYAPDVMADWSIRTWRQIYLESQDDHPGSKHNRGTRRAFKTENWPDALVCAEAAATVDGADRFVHNLAEARLRTGDASGALACCDEASSPNDRLRLVLTAHALWLLGRREEALARMGQALARQPSNARLLLQYGEWLLLEGRPVQALAALERSVAVAPLNNVSLSRLGEARQAVADLAGASGGVQSGGGGHPPPPPIGT